MEILGAISVCLLELYCVGGLLSRTNACTAAEGVKLTEYCPAQIMHSTILKGFTTRQQEMNTAK
jgi:hypothetical protein